MKPTYKELVREVERLRTKLSPLENKEFTAKVKAAMDKFDLSEFRQQYRGSPYLVGRPGELWGALMDGEPNSRDITLLGRSLQALGWERSAHQGNIVFRIPLEEYESGR